MRKRIMVALMLSALMLWGCEEVPSGTMAKEGARIVIITEENGTAVQTGEHIRAILEQRGYAAVTSTEGAKEKGTVITVGKVQPAKGAEVLVSCGLSAGSGFDIEPRLSSGTVARAAVLLLSDAEHFLVISSKAGATDVQDACDVFDKSGVDYTVETLEGRTAADAALSAEKKGCDAVILPFGNGAKLPPLSAAVIAVGNGEPVKGALATFCIDGEALAKACADLAVSRLTENEDNIPRGGYYTLCISESVAADCSVDVEAVREDYPVLLVE